MSVFTLPGVARDVVARRLVTSRVLPRAGNQESSEEDENARHAPVRSYWRACLGNTHRDTLAPMKMTTPRWFGAVAVLTFGAACSAETGNPGAGGSLSASGAAGMSGGPAGGSGAGGSGTAGMGTGGMGNAGMAGAGTAGMGTSGAAGTAGMGAGGEGGTPIPAGLPADRSAASIKAWLDANSYSAWVADAATPRPTAVDEETGMPLSSVHGDGIKVFSNPILQASAAAGKGVYMGEVPHDVHSFSVKEMYDATGTTLEGRAVMWRNDAGWTYYCDGPGSRCSTEEDATPLAEPLWEEVPDNGFGEISCVFCHAGLIFAPVPPP